MAEKKEGVKFNTFSGVFVPSVLAIFGAVMYLILPKVVGGVGLLQILAIIIIAHSVSIATAFSLSAIATNIKVKGGGMYYLISRSLGSEFGGGLGLQLFLAQTVAISFYCIAFAKGMKAILSMIGILDHLPEMYIAFVACLIFGIVAFEGARFVIKLQYFILASILLSLVSVFFAPVIENVSSAIAPGISLPFWVAFALFFPAVTGIDAGVGMSGDLKNPKKSLVNGTFAAISFTFLIYILLAIKIFNSASLGDLFNNPLIMEKISLIPGLVLAGLLFATASSALSYFMTAPRTLRALADDKIFSKHTKFLGKSIGHSTEPRVALIVCLVIALGVIVTSGLDFVSQIVTIFFLNVYGWINGSAFFEKISRNPSYRPSFNPPGMIHFYGMAASYFVMYLYNPWVMIISILFQLTVFYILYKTKASIKLESVWDGVLFQFLRNTINRIEKSAKSKKNWRPTIVAFSSTEINRSAMFSLLDWIGANRGIMKFYYLLQGNVDRSVKKRDEIEDDMKNHVKEDGLELFPRVIETNDKRDAIETAIQSETIGNLPLNTALIDFESGFDIENIIKLTTRLNKNILILKNNTGFSDFKVVDVWWDKPDNGNLMILIAYLITHSKQWLRNDASIRLFTVVKNDEEYKEIDKKIDEMITQSRIDNISAHIIKQDNKKMPNIIKENSHYADLVLIGMPHDGKGMPKSIVKRIDKYTEGLTTSLIVEANDKIDFRIN